MFRVLIAETPSNIFCMFITFAVLNVLIFRLARLLALLNMYPMFVTFSVLNVLKSRLAKLLDSANMPSMLVT